MKKGLPYQVRIENGLNAEINSFASLAEAKTVAADRVHKAKESRIRCTVEVVRVYSAEYCDGECQDCETDGQSTYCGSMCDACLAEHCEECEVCAADFA